MISSITAKRINKVIKLLNEFNEPLPSSGISVFLKFNKRTTDRVLKIMRRKNLVDSEVKNDFKKNRPTRFYKPKNKK